MRWFEGTVEEAVRKIRAQNALFIVFIGDDDEKSVNMLRSLEAVPNTEGNDVVALQLKPGTLPFRQFSQIYPVSTIPASFVIAANGSILKSINGDDDIHSTRAKVIEVLRAHRKSSQNYPDACESRNRDQKTVITTDVDREHKVRQRQTPKSEEDLRKKERCGDEPALEKPVTVEPSRTDVRLQFRLPDGSSVIHRFENSTSLNEVFKFVREVVRPSFVTFSLHVAFPSRELNPSEEHSCLLDLGLAPSAAILILPSSKSLAATSSPVFGFLWAIIGSILSGFSAIGSYISGILPSTPTATNMDRSSKTSVADEKKGGRGGGKRDGPSHMYGNIHRLANNDSDDDENKTWNGNSTQQM